MTRERAEELLNHEVVYPNGWVVVLRGLFSDEAGQVSAMCYTQENGKDYIGVSCLVEDLEEYKQ